MQDLWVAGLRDFGFEIADIARQAGFRIVGFIDYGDGPPQGELTDESVIRIDDLTGDIPAGAFVCAMTSTLLRRSIAQRIDELSQGRLQPTIVMHPHAINGDSCQVGAGSTLGAGSILASGTKLGRFNLINRGATIGHHTKLGDFCTIGPGANVGGNCNFGNHSYVGIGATILNHRKIGEHTLIGAGSVVTKDVPARTQVMGVPARIVRRNIEGR